MYVYTVAGVATATCYEIKEIKRRIATQYMSARPFKPRQTTESSQTFKQNPYCAQD